MSEIYNLSATSDESDLEYFSPPTLACDKKIIDLNLSLNSDDSIENVIEPEHKTPHAIANSIFLWQKNSEKI